MRESEPEPQIIVDGLFEDEATEAAPVDRSAAQHQPDSLVRARPVERIEPDVAVRKFQTFKRLTVDGIVGPTTRTALG